MGRRSRTRARTDGVEPPARAARAARPKPQRATTSRVRKVLSIQLGLVVLLCVLVLVGIVMLGGKLGPFVVVAYSALGAGLLFHVTRTKLSGEPLNDDDRVLQTVATGLSVMAVGFALLSALLVNVT